MLPLFCCVTRHMLYNTLHNDLMDICHLWCYLTILILFVHYDKTWNVAKFAVTAIYMH